MTKAEEYTLKLAGAITDAIKNEDSEFYIGGLKELETGDNMTEFAHALLNLAPMFIYDKLTDSGDDILGMNYTANRLIYQFKGTQISGDDDLEEQ